jgi:molybdopterin synthase catalytic subunit
VHAVELAAPATGDDWLALTPQPLDIAAAYDWAVRPSCGAVVLFSGTVRDHATDEAGVLRAGVTGLTYEAYAEQAVPKMAEVARELRIRWPRTGRVVIHHRVGPLQLGDSSVVVAVSSPHRPEAFEAARFGIDAVKAAVPIWKLESWDGGSDWGTGAHVPVDPSQVQSA